MTELFIWLTVAVLLVFRGTRPRPKAKVYVLDSALWAKLLRERKDGRGWRRKNRLGE